MSSQTPLPPATSLESTSSKESNDESDRLEAQRSYAREILKMPIRLTTAEIGRYVESHSAAYGNSYTLDCRNRPMNTSLLYDRMPLQCKQCALRFHDNARGKIQMQDHLDSHFRQNRRAKETAGRGHSRSWFISIQVCVNSMIEVAVRVANSSLIGFPFRTFRSERQGSCWQCEWRQ